jgi:hypothetical protein
VHGRGILARIQAEHMFNRNLSKALSEWMNIIWCWVARYRIESASGSYCLLTEESIGHNHGKFLKIRWRGNDHSNDSVWWTFYPWSKLTHLWESHYSNSLWFNEWPMIGSTFSMRAWPKSRVADSVLVSAEGAYFFFLDISNRSDLLSRTVPSVQRPKARKRHEQCYNQTKSWSKRNEMES